MAKKKKKSFSDEVGGFEAEQNLYQTKNFFFLLHPGKQGINHYEADLSSIKFTIFLFYWYKSAKCVHMGRLYCKQKCSAKIGLNAD